MRNAVIAALVRHYPSAAKAAAALGITRQAFNAALSRQHLSEKATIAAAALLGIDPGEALKANASAAANLPPPILDTAAKLPAQCHITTYRNTNYALSNGIKKTTKAAIHPTIHVITSKAQDDAIDLIRWVYAVARLPADSPRFNWYVSRWAVPEKIATAKKAGTFDELTRNCPPIDPAWVRFAPAAFAACDEFKEATSKPPKNRPTSSKEMPIESNRNKKAA